MAPQPPCALRVTTARAEDFLDLLSTGEPILLLLPISLAAGVDFFLALLILGLTQDLGWMGIQPEGLHPLQWAVMGGIAGLYLLEAMAEFRHVTALLWHNLQLLVRPLAAALMVFALLDGLPTGLRASGALVGAIVSAFAHVLSWGLKLRRFLQGRRKVAAATAVLAEDLLVIAFVFLATEDPELGAMVSVLLLLIGILLGGSFHHVVRFGFRIVQANLLKHPGHNPRHRVGELPRWVKKGIEAHGLSRLQNSPEEIEGLFGLWGMPAGIYGVPGVRGFREGWVLVDGTQTYFMFRHRSKSNCVRLDADSFGEQEPWGMAQRVPITHPDGGHSALFLQGRAPGLKSHK